MVVDILVTVDQLANEVFSNITAKPHSLSIFNGGSNHLFQEVSGLVEIQHFSPSNHIAQVVYCVQFIVLVLGSWVIHKTNLLRSRTCVLEHKTKDVKQDTILTARLLWLQQAHHLYKKKHYSHKVKVTNKQKLVKHV